MNTKLVAILVGLISVGAIALLSTGALSPQQASTSYCNTEDPNLLTGGFTAGQSTSFTYTINVHNGQSQTVTLASYTLETQSYSINLAIAAGQNGTFTTVQDPNSETSIQVKTSCGNQIMTASYTENIAPESTTFEDSTSVAVDLQNNGTETITLTSYYVTDSSGNQYTLPNWNGPSLAPNSVTTTTFSIGSSCSQCTLHGSAYTFTSGNQYTIMMVTGRGNTFTFTVNFASGHHYSIVLEVGFGSTAH